jgi:peroxiredoxin
MRGLCSLAAMAVVTGLIVSTAVAEEKAEIGQQAPNFELKDQDGNTVSLSDFEGKVVVLEWFNQECPYVVRHHPSEKTMPTLAAKYKDQDVVWLAINSTSHHNVEKNKETAQNWSIQYPLLDDSSGKVGRAYDAKTTPHMYIIDTQGVLVFNGGIDNDPRGNNKDGRTNYVDKALQEVLAGESVSTAQSRPYGCTIKFD